MSVTAETDTPPSSTKRGAGRPRDPALERRIKTATLEVLAAGGFSGLTLERVCAAAGVPKATFYRRWSTPVDVAIEAFNERFEHGLLEDTGDLRADLTAFTDRLIDLYADPVLGPCTTRMITEAKHRPAEFQPVLAAQQARRRHNRNTLESALAAAGLDTGMSARLMLSVLNGLASFSFSTGRTATHDDFVLLIDKLLTPA